jgi:hypothetical protein
MHGALLVVTNSNQNNPPTPLTMPPPAAPRSASGTGANSVAAAAAAAAGQSLFPRLFPSGLPNMTAESLNVASRTRQLPPPPQLPLIQLPGRHQDAKAFHTDATSTTAPNATTCTTAETGAGSRGPRAGPSCPHRMQWAGRGDHPPPWDAAARTARLSEDQLETLVDDMAVIVRREFDCWVQACW